ncbi:MAG: hypothetical protein NC900_00640 [Candidatus Omnitrophica bacterium]|nr:hypothetical protein [Candidatus Omnitrophota bacterium]
MRNKKLKVKFILIYILIFVNLLGCDAFLRKFRRKPKKESLEEKEMVLVPDEYPSLFVDKEDQYRSYFLYWKSWHSEFINSLIDPASHKRRIFCLDEAIKNLKILSNLLLEEKSFKLNFYIKELTDLRDSLSKDIYTTNLNWYYQRAEIIRKNILRDFSYPKIKDYLR